MKFDTKLGVLSLSLNEQDKKILIGNYQAETLFKVANRNNPKRKFLFVSELLSRHIPKSINGIADDIYCEVAQKISPYLKGNTLILSMAETATQIGVKTALNLDNDNVLLLNSTRELSHFAPVLTVFREDHSHAVSHQIQFLGNLHKIDTLLICDDEYSTGNTLFNAVAELREKGLRPKRIITFAFLDWRKNIGQFEKLYGCEEFAFCLASGEFEFQENSEQIIQDEILGTIDLTSSDSQKITVTDLLKMGCTPSEIREKLSHFGSYLANGKVLVLATGENHFEAEVFAKSIKNAEVDLGSITRSPILVDGKVIKSKHSINLNGSQRYLYNAMGYDRIFVYFNAEDIQEIKL